MKSSEPFSGELRTSSHKSASHVQMPEVADGLIDTGIQVDRNPWEILGLSDDGNAGKPFDFLLKDSGDDLLRKPDYSASPALGKLAELEKTIETQFQQLLDEGLALDRQTHLSDRLLEGTDGSSRSKLDALEKLEKALEKDHKGLVADGILPEDTLHIFT